MRACVLVLATLAALGSPRAARAHDLRAAVTVGERVTVLAFYDDDAPAERADATVTDAAGAVVAVGRTDERGVWAFDRPAPGAYALEVRAAGHIGRAAFRVEGTPGAAPETFAEARPNKALGLALGVAGLLALSGAYWFIRRGRAVR